ncbi:hypothetical protein GCK72_024184 [Caenorhabditis remanei]|uniref:RING-type domain-containing protein n=1 Tax=Caenorhabditis remanei TaxID=31234 RepID=A0A6A5FYK8_CAERE|nr:hypothetical protein GCK72_024184 [Caenorhabditis remanei]KAF1747718.1 hypothetical protein GCK72_024184 [Caenorhabditis remanei]
MISMDKKNIDHLLAHLDLIDVQCHVCFHVNTDPVIFVKCKHSLCGGCAGRWLASTSVCPMCRAQVEEIEPDQELKQRADRFLLRHPENRSPHDIYYEQTVNETVFWSIQQRKKAGDSDRVFYGMKPAVPENMTEEEAEEFLEARRIESVRKRLDELNDRIAIQTPLVQAQYREELFVHLSNKNDATFRYEDYEWQMVNGRGLIRVPRSTNRFYCPLRFRRAHST